MRISRKLFREMSDEELSRYYQRVRADFIRLFSSNPRNSDETAIKISNSIAYDYTFEEMKKRNLL